MGSNAYDKISEYDTKYRYQRKNEKFAWTMELCQRLSISQKC